MRKSLVFGTLSLIFVMGLPACGDEPATDTSSTGTDDTGDGDGDTASTTMEEVTTATMDSGDGDGDDATGDGDTGDGDTGDGDTGDGDTGDGDTGDGDGDGDGDCEMGYSTMNSADTGMSTNLTVEGIISCDKGIDIVATGGSVCVNDDGSGGYFYTVEEITFEDVPTTSCGLAELGLSSLSMINIGDYTEVVIPQGGGAMTGNQSTEVLGDAYGTAIGMTIDPTPLADFTGVLPEGSATAEAGTTTFTYDDASTVLATAMPEVSGFTLTVTLTGLTGSLTFDN